MSSPRVQCAIPTIIVFLPIAGVWGLCCHRVPVVVKCKNYAATASLEGFALSMVENCSNVRRTVCIEAVEVFAAVEVTSVPAGSFINICVEIT